MFRLAEKPTHLVMIGQETDSRETSHAGIGINTRRTYGCTGRTPGNVSPSTSLPSRRKAFSTLFVYAALGDTYTPMKTFPSAHYFCAHLSLHTAVGNVTHPLHGISCPTSHHVLSLAGHTRRHTAAMYNISHTYAHHICFDKKREKRQIR